MSTPLKVHFGAIVGLALVLGACGGPGSRVDAGAGSTVSPSTVAETTAAESVASTSPSTTTSDMPSTSGAPPPTSVPLVNIDVTQLISSDDVAELADLAGPILLPTALPAWTADSEFWVARIPDIDSYALKWSVYSEGAEVRIDVLHFGLSRADPQFDYELPTAGTAHGAARTYSLQLYEGEPCDGTGGEAVLAWEEGGYRYDVTMFPRPDCPGAAVDALQQAIGVADSLREYAIIDGTLTAVVI